MSLLNDAELTATQAAIEAARRWDVALPCRGCGAMLRAQVLVLGAHGILCADCRKKNVS